ncbi:MAG: radical SAM protein [Vicinamibacterales bacterium]|nr:radical SAM protein [Vicinamibacterales bacterium]
MALRFDDAPQRVYWELTRACDLSCSHCRANANPSVDPRELSTADIFRVLDEFAAGSRPHIILTGGDPLKRRDFFDIVAHTVGLGLPCLVAPSATPLLTDDVIQTLAAMRVTAMSLSLDGSTPARHDGVRGVAGTFDRTLRIARAIVHANIPLQINTLVTAQTRDELADIYRVVRDIGAERWSLFFLIGTGRGARLSEVSPAESDDILNWVLDHEGGGRPIITTTEAPHYRRLALTRHKKVRGMGIRDGNGVMFISHIGEIQPSGFLPLTAGYARTENPLQVYRDSPLFQTLRQTERFAGRCGCCEFREACGGSRARAYAATGDPFASDPLCTYQPAALTDQRAMLRD